ncbi:hypothetical protein [Streptomyces sp. H34-S4]|uniref:hypothetical protein n=1 Tax=Streptomyces sp. H34-S4 TaxID=2996463 RepID=UPI0022718E6F|nr:hypothetical protein [Streptomyces sp. H34-S4]MCY0933904.1 hypothetical protein [Streptomyces sp. H34-S4]
MSARKTSRSERTRARRRRRLHAKGVLAFLGGLGSVAVAAALFTVLPETVAEERAYASARPCTTPQALPEEECIRTAPYTVLKIHIQGGRGAGYWAKVEDQAHGRRHVDFDTDEPLLRQLSVGDQVTAHVWRGDITAVSGREMVQASGDSPQGVPLYAIALGLVCAVMGGLGLAAAWWWLRRTDDCLAGHPRALRVSGWIAMGLAADAFATLWMLLWLDGPYWLHPIVWSAATFPVLAALAVQRRRRGGGEL